jgi:hypothetical protein
MNEQNPKPVVTPPDAYKPPSLPTLAALGVIASAALLTGCEREEAEEPLFMGLMIDTPTEEKILETTLAGALVMPGEVAPPHEEKSPELTKPGEMSALPAPGEKESRFRTSGMPAPIIPKEKPMDNDVRLRGRR